MPIFPAIKELPERYHVLTVIRSVELKSKLADRIHGIFGLLDFFDTVEPEPETVKLVKSFMDYLHNTCNNHTLVQRRAGWLYRYAVVVYDHLFLIKHGPVLSRESVMVADDDEYRELIATLAETIVAYHARPQVLQPLDYQSYRYLQLLIEFSTRVRPDLQYGDYVIARDRIFSLTETMMNLVASGAVLSDDATVIVTELRAIHFHIDRFVSHKGTLL